MLLADAPVRPLGPADLTACLDLGADRDWPREHRKWSILLDVGRGFGIDAPDGDGLAATSILVETGPVASISMVVVASRYGRQGLGGRVTSHAVGAAGDTTVFLHASSLGQRLYESLGFVVDGGCEGHLGTLADDGGPAARPITPADVARVYELDALAQGFPRRALLDRLLFEAEHVHVTDDGFALGTVLDGVTVIGPVVAPSEDEAKALVRGIARATGGPIRVDVDFAHAGLSDWCRASGLLPVGPAPRLVHGGKALPGLAERRFAPYNRALG
ncbi:GNAT family N-acetyltransferase [Amycolatopsis sp. FDAARGOS 1241]|uniref:GNAT family N-acetyltransferase n=1 Tax=Amycolatopsis sp. FDAARGOS 1241 TaxID=2778070 RepID=UPI0019508F05|nr:GNAT family N-acetyltransferase [Amycolatopsis sp. FDAARGOS 1241]QRP45161.1 GNAT family N-acetyltransferase [Amycolatopsis sp. FDAARGOS 1241]